MMIDIAKPHYINLTNEDQLHKKVIDFIKTYFPEAIIVSGCVNQTTDQLRLTSYMKGYIAGQPDILILNDHPFCRGLAIELKSPTGLGKESKKQIDYMKKLEKNLWSCIISNNYDDILIRIVRYFDDIRNNEPQEEEERFTTSEIDTDTETEDDVFSPKKARRG
jgi:hypothetical protein